MWNSCCICRNTSDLKSKGVIRPNTRGRGTRVFRRFIELLQMWLLKFSVSVCTLWIASTWSAPLHIDTFIFELFSFSSESFDLNWTPVYITTSCYPVGFATPQYKIWRILYRITCEKTMSPFYVELFLLAFYDNYGVFVRIRLGRSQNTNI